jgi:hypothetical protein
LTLLEVGAEVEAGMRLNPVGCGVRSVSVSQDEIKISSRIKVDKFM